MSYLFSYGSLQHTSVQITTFGRVVASAPDRLVGYTKTAVPITDPNRARIHGASHYENVVPTLDTRSEVSGVTLEVTDEELARADAYEAEDGYARMRAFTAAGHHVWVYVSTS